MNSITRSIKYTSLVFDGQGNQTGRYFNGPGMDFVLAEEKGDGAILWALADNQGSVRDLVNESGAIVSHISYDSFGRVLSRTGNVNFRYGYTGRERDEETGLEYYRARYYDAAVGRFVSEDPIGFGAGDTNLFRYVGNSPTNFIDPTGEQSVAGQPSEFDPVSTAGAVVVGSLNTKDGTVIETIEGGIRNSSWHFVAPPAPPIDPPPPDEEELCPATGDFNSTVGFDTGGVTETHDLVSYQSLGESRGLTLTYSSLRADPRPILNFESLSLVSARGFGDFGLYLSAGVSIKDGKFSEATPKAYWNVPELLTRESEQVTTSVQIDMRNKRSGLFDYQANIGFEVPSRSGIGRASTITGKVTNINFVDSNFGSGWGISGVQEIVENGDGSILLIDGGGGHMVFDKPEQVGGAYTSPAGDSSRLVKLVDGTFQRTTADLTVYKFDSENRLVSVKDSLSRETQHVYNAAGQLSQVIDPTGLATVLSYGANGKVASITDPASRVTVMVYDGQGNLVRITNPDGTARSFSYDAGHHMTEEINQQGNQELSFYDPVSGRATHSIRADGSEIHLTAKQTIGLYDPVLTRSSSTAPILTSIEPKTTYIDGNGNISYYQLDDTGHAISTVDGVGGDGTVERDAQERIILRTDSLGNKTRYSYDDRGNVIRMVQETSSTVSFSNTGNTVSEFGQGFGNPYDVSTEMADVNNDGWQDAVVLSKSFDTAENNISVWLGAANGKFTLKNTYALSTTNTNFKVQDLNSDGRADMLVGKDNEAIVYLGDGQGGFSQHSTYGLNFAQLATISLTDVNGDQFDDMAYRSSNAFYLRLGRGDGEFGAAFEESVDWQDYTGGGYGAARLAIATPVAAPNTAGEISTGDLDGDGKVDWLVPTSQGFRVVLNKGLCDYRPQTEVSTGIFVTSSAAALVDADQDGDLDVLSWVRGFTPTEQNIKLYLNSGTGSFADSATIGVGFSIESVVVTDFDGNQTQDLVVQGSDSTGIILGNGNGTFQPIEILGGLPNSVRSIAVGDFDGYGLNDLLTFTTTGITLVPGWSLELGQSSKPGSVTSYTYDAVWNKLTSETDPLGRKTLYEIDVATGHQLSMTQVVGLEDSISGETNDVTTRYTYIAQGLMDTETDALGRVTDYDYNVRGNLVRSIQAKGTTDEAVTTYEYDLAGNQTAMIDPLGRRTEYRYNAANMLTRTIEPDPDGVGPQAAPVRDYQYDKMGNRVLERDARGNATRYEYDAMGRMTKMIGADPDGSGAQVSAVTTYEYDLDGNQVAVVDPLGRRTTSVYDVRNRLVAVIDANGGKQQMIYDTENRLVSSIDTNGNRSTMIYDSEGRVVREVNALNQVEDTEFDGVGQVVSTTDALGRKTRYQYDELGRQVAVTDALGHVTRSEYNKVGNVVAAIDANGNRTEFKYDALNRRIEVKDAQGGVTKTVYDKVGNTISVADALNRTTSFNYDALDRLITTTDPLGHSSTNAFDAVGNLLNVTDALGRSTTFAYDNLNRRVATTDVLGQTQSVVYDVVNNVVSVTDELGQVTTFAYDALNRRTGVTDALGYTQSTVYDAAGNVRSTTDAIGNITSFDYDALNRQVKVTDAEAGTTGTSYDVIGNVAKITDSVGNSTTYTYDAVNRLLTDTNQLGFSRSFVYDAVGNRVEMIDRNNRKTTYTYDSLNRETSENWIGAGGVNLRAIGYTYDAVGNLLKVTDPDAKYIYTYDGLNRTTSVDNTGTIGVPAVAFNYLYDAVGRLVTVGDRINNTNAGQTDYAYDLLNRTTSITQLGTGVQAKRVNMTYNKVNQMTGLSRFSDLGGVNLVAETSYVYDQNQRLTQLAHKKGTSNLASYDYTYDAANKLTKIVSSVDGTVDYTYDATNQLTGADHSSQADEDYQYDANGNRTNAGYQTGTNNQLLADGQFTYEYDYEGNRTKRTEVASGKVTEYVWDYHNRLTGVVFKDAAGAVLKSIEYTYDVSNQRIGKKIDGVVTERYVLDRNQIALVFDGQGVQKARYLYGTQVDQVLAEESGTQVRWFLTDHQGTVKDVIENAGAVINHITYDSFGRIVNQTNPIELRFAYTGREWDGETGQYYYRARYYDPADGRFISEDPINFNGGDTNLNRYVMNQAIILKDPTGKIPLNRDEEYRVDPVYRSPEQTRIDNAAYRVQVRHGTQEWDEGKFLQWRAGLLNINEFKNQWVCGYKDVIDGAAREFNISPRLLAAVSRLEVGGKPSSSKRLTYDIRSVIGRQPVPFLNRDADETSFGNLGIQIRTAAGVLGYPTNRNLTYSEALSIRYALEDSRYNIFIGAAYLSQLQNRYLPGRDPNTLTDRELMALAGAYNRGAAYGNLEDFWKYKYAQYGVSAFKGLRSCGCY